ncbi:rubrerythrin family protein [Halorientalis halophila]|uniref:rubrerythrin family protein n=1 Tax=Halorientalis halophila TaxID=3108499 RepID=UPI0030083F71
MDGQAFLERVREDERTALERLGSDKALLAATGADLDADTVLGVLAATERYHRETFERWAEAAADEAAADAFRAAAETAGTHVERLQAGRSEDAAETADDLETGVGGQDDDVARAAAGLVGASLVLDRTLLQAVNFFVNEADERRANLIREVRTATEDRLETGLDLLDELCEGDADWERAMDTATDAVAAAYDDYAERLEEMGIDPKPVC